jgi:zinc protease
MLRKTLILTMLLLSAAAVASGAEKEQPLPKDMPPYGPLKPFVAPQVTVQKLANGLTIWLVPRPGFPKVAFVFSARGGYAADPTGLPGLSDLILSTIDQGTKTRSARKVAEDMQAAGGDLTGTADSDSLMLATQVLASKADAGLDVVADVVQNATFPDSEVALAKRNQADNLRSEEADPSFLARRAFNREVFGDHPYSVMSLTEDSITKATAEDIRKEYARRFRPDHSALVAVGDFDAAKLSADIESLFGKWENPSQPAVSAVPAVPSSVPHDVFFIPRADSVQTTFEVGSLTATRRDPDYVPTEVANAIYGGMFGSRLIKNIREDKGYTYSPFAMLSSRDATGLLATRADVRNPVTGASLNEISYELNRMATTEPTPDELTRAQRYLVGLEALRLQSEAGVARQLATLWQLGMPPATLSEENARIPKVTLAEVQEAGSKYFPFARQTVVAVGDQKTIESQLAVFGMKIEQAK